MGWTKWPRTHACRGMSIDGCKCLYVLERVLSIVHTHLYHLKSKRSVNNSEFLFTNTAVQSKSSHIYVLQN